MIEFASLVAGAVLLLLLTAAALKGWLASQPLIPGPAAVEEDATALCPEELVNRVFSGADWEFVRGLRAAGIERLFERERKKVALVWVRQTSALIRRVINEHAQAARHSKNLEFSTEITIFAQFLMLMAVCGILSVAIQIAGPLWLGGLAHFAQRLSQRVSKLQETFQAGVLANAGEAESA
jgi:flagellar biosynthesis protein FlhB